MKTISISYKNGKYFTIKGKELSIITPSPTMVLVQDQGVTIYVGNISDIRYVREKLNEKTTSYSLSPMPKAEVNVKL